MKQLIFGLLITFFILPAYSAPIHKVLMVVNQGYRPEEYFAPRKIFDREGFQVTVAGHYLGKILPSKPHISEVPPIKVDVTFDKVNVSDFDAVVFVGGNGAWNDLLPNVNVHKILLESSKQNKITGLICAATGLLATAGNLDGDHPQFKGRHVTGFNDVEGLIKKVGLMNYDKGVEGKPFVVTDGNLITGRDPISAEQFGEVIAKTLKK